MPETQFHCPYESPALQAEIGPALRPGGLALTRRALSFCDVPPGSLVVDIGCGIGTTVQFLRRDCGFRAFGLDRSPVMLGQARRGDSGLPLIKATATRLPFRDGRLSAVLCECVLSLLDDDDRPWREFHRILGPGGYLVVADLYARAPECAYLLSSLPHASCLKGARTRERLLWRLHQGGFTLLAWEDHSQELRRLAARLAFSGWSLQAFWGDSGACGARQDIQTAIRQAKPGYFLMVALKRGDG